MNLRNIVDLLHTGSKMKRAVSNTRQTSLAKYLGRKPEVLLCMCYEKFNYPTNIKKTT